MFMMINQQTSIGDVGEDVVEEQLPVAIIEASQTVGGEKLDQDLFAQSPRRETKFADDGSEKDGDGRRQILLRILLLQHDLGNA